MWLHKYRHHRVPIVGTCSGGITLPSRGPYSGNEPMCLHNPRLLGVPVVGRNQCDYITAAISGSPYWGATMWVHNPTFSGSTKWRQMNVATQPLTSRAARSGDEAMCLHNPCLLGVP